MTFTYTHQRPSVTTDSLVFSIRNDALHVLLIKRKIDPFLGAWALPGGFVKMDEDLISGARRELAEETGLTDISLRQFATYGDVARDPRDRVITVVFFALVPSMTLVPLAGSDASDVRWWDVSALPDLAFDHARILQDGRKQLADETTQTSVPAARTPFAFLDKEFTLAEAQQVFEILQGAEIDKRNFRKWLPKAYPLIDLKKTRKGGRHRPAALFTINEDFGD